MDTTMVPIRIPHLRFAKGKWRDRSRTPLVTVWTLTRTVAS